MASIAKFESLLDVTVIDRNGQPTGEKRMLCSPALTHYYPDEPVVYVNWLWEGAERPTEAQLQAPITCNGKTYQAHWAWGSSVKKGYTIGLTHDILRESGLGAKAEDGQRFGRWLLPNALYGACTGDLKIKVVKPGTVIGGYPVEDGMGYVRQGIVSIARNQRSAIKLGAVNDSFHICQRLEWTDELAAESIPHINARLITMSDPLVWLASNRVRFDQKAELVHLEKRMELHPYIANSLNRSRQAYATRLATTIPMNASWRNVVPTTAATIAARGKYVVGRYPIDSNSSTRAVEADADQAEIDRISGMEVAQYTLCSPRFMAKGNIGVVADDVLGNYDIVICTEDVKMAANGVSNARQSLCLDGHDSYLGLTQYWAAGSSIGINAAFWKVMGGDFDGDGAAVVDCSERPALWNAVGKLPEQPTYKLIKTNSAWSKGDMRARMIVKSLECAVIVGFATNVAAATFAVRDRALLAKAIGYDVAALDKELNNLIKIGTDGFKADVDTEKAEKRCAVLQSAIQKALGKGAPWCSWSKDTYAFRHAVPQFAHLGMKDKSEEARICIPATMDGTVPQICKITLPQIDRFLTVQIEAKPLMAFDNWADECSESLIIEAEALQTQYNFRVKQTNFSDPAAIDDFTAWWTQEVQGWIDSSKSPKAALADALWHVAHNARSAQAGAGSVFMADPLREEVLDIVRNKPGLRKGSNNNVVVTGLQFALPADRLDLVVAKVEIVEHRQVKDGKVVVRKVILSSLNGQKPAGAGWPTDMLGVVSTESRQPEEGLYNARFVRHGDARMWRAELEEVRLTA